MSPLRAGRVPVGPMLAGLCATLIGVGLQRFAYSPLLPVMVAARWLSPGAAGALGGANFAGYLVGALAAGWTGRLCGVRRALRGAMVVAALCFLLCAHDGGLLWLLPWRTLAGVAGGTLMVLAGPAVQVSVPPAQRPRAGGVMFAGVGSGIAIGAAIVPLLLPWGVAATWLVLAATAAVLALLAWRHVPDVAAPADPGLPRLPPTAWRLILSYAVSAAAITPHMLFWPDYLARGLGYGADIGAFGWLGFGLAAMVGPMLFSSLAIRFGTITAYRASVAAQGVAALLPVLLHAVPVLVVSTLLAGSSAVGATTLVIPAGRELAGERAPAIWRLGTAAWGAAQTVTGFALAALLAATGSHVPLFALGAAAGLLAALLVPKKGGGAG
ncbi:MAG: YbfB/YjiJ family MFS transporter [Rhodospirillales bacterium]|nr:YbfB/YjiJ family MFS transporter [Rhodospirillales bacterium]